MNYYGDELKIVVAFEPDGGMESAFICAVCGDMPLDILHDIEQAIRAEEYGGYPGLFEGVASEEVIVTEIPASDCTAAYWDFKPTGRRETWEDLAERAGGAQ